MPKHFLADALLCPEEVATEGGQANDEAMDWVTSVKECVGELHGNNFFGQGVGDDNADKESGSDTSSGSSW